MPLQQALVQVGDLEDYATFNNQKHDSLAAPYTFSIGTHKHDSLAVNGTGIAAAISGMRRLCPAAFQGFTTLGTIGGYWAVLGLIGKAWLPFPRLLMAHMSVQPPGFQGPSGGELRGPYREA